MSKYSVLIVFVSLVLFVGCNSDVPPGHVGQVKTSSGWSGKVLAPGLHTCYGRDEMWVVENRDTTKSEAVQVLLQKDQVNFGVTASLTFTLKDDAKDVIPVFDRVKPSATEGGAKKISLDDVYTTYARPIVLSQTNRVVMVYTTEQILADANKLQNELQTAIMTQLEGTPVKVKFVLITNLDFPEFITKAQEKAKNAEVAIKEEEFKQKSRLIEAENKMKVAEVDYQVKLLEAKTIADANRIIGESLEGEAGAAYLRWHEIKVYGAAADGPNNCIFLPMNLMGPLGHEAAMTPLRDKLTQGIKGTKAPEVKVPKINLPDPANVQPPKAESEVPAKTDNK